MRKYRIAIAAFLLHAILLGSMPVLAQHRLYTVYVNGVKVSGYPLVRDGVAYLPVNTLAEALGLNIRWDASLNIIKVNNKLVAARPLNEDGRLFLPVEAVTHSLGGSVEWDGPRQAIRIHTGQAVAVEAPVSASPSVPSPVLTVPVTPLPAPSVRPVVPVAPATTTTTSTNPFTIRPVPPATTTTTTSTYTPPPTYTPAAQPPATYTPPPPAPTTTTAHTSDPSSAYASRSVYVPKTAQNNVFAVTVTNMESVNTIKDFYHPRPGYRFVILYLSQQNVSNEVQIYTGRFSLLDQSNRSHDYIEGLSNFWLVILRPYGINFGYLVFEVPNDAQPTRLALHALNQSLTLNL
ncbi:MAG: DUF4352 domain-containing protein [Armatimonadetes bacterium]|nr:DUF4352 domain-containing protein [Armatimonadota bacterium]